MAGEGMSWAPDGQHYALVVDDHPLVARGIAEYLQTHCGFELVRLAADGAECLRCVQTQGSPTLAVVDFWLPDGAALSLLRELLPQCPSTRLLVLSGDEDFGVQIKVREAGAQGFLCKHEPPEVFARAVASLLAGADWFPHSRELTLPQAPRRELPVQARDLGLTERQGQVLSMMLRGLPNKHIARALALSEQTVKEHVTSILGRLGVANRMEAIKRLQGRRIEA